MSLDTISKSAHVRAIGNMKIGHNNAKKLEHILSTMADITDYTSLVISQVERMCDCKHIVELDCTDISSLAKVTTVNYPKYSDPTVSFIIDRILISKLEAWHRFLVDQVYPDEKMDIMQSYEEYAGVIIVDKDYSDGSPYKPNLIPSVALAVVFDE